MNLDRVVEILSSDQEIAVHFHGVPVWIESIDGDIQVWPLFQSEGTHGEKQVVSIDALRGNWKILYVSRKRHSIECLYT